MVITIQKIIPHCMLVLLCSTSFTLFAQDLTQCGTGDLIVSKKNVGTARYFAQNCRQPWQQQNIQMDFKYSQNIPEWAFKRAANYLLKRNIQDAKTEKLLEPITNAYKPVQSGDVYRLKYTQNNQTLSLYLNGQLLHKIQHPLAHQYFNIWLGPKPFNVKLKQQLLNE